MRRARLDLNLDAPEVIAAAVAPDDTPEMDTRIEDGTVVATMERPTTGGLRSTVDDYVVNADVARRTVHHADELTNP